jgi:predicted nucleic-acid-binding Zn-ribbon protein
MLSVWPDVLEKLQAQQNELRVPGEEKDEVMEMGEKNPRPHPICSECGADVVAKIEKYLQPLGSQGVVGDYDWYAVIECPNCGEIYSSEKL